MRINKYIASLTKYSRRQVDGLILQGKVKINNRVLTKNELGQQVIPETDKVLLNNKLLQNQKQKFIYLALNKPKGFICTNKRQAGQKIALDLIPKNLTVNNIGRLDKNSHGLLIFTNNGDLILKLAHPKFQHEKEYLVKTKKSITSDQIKKLKQGINLEEGLAKAKKVTKINEYVLKIVLTTGYKRQIRRMLEAVHNKVSDLQRTRINKLKLGHLPKGKWRYIKKEEII